MDVVSENRVYLPFIAIFDREYDDQPVNVEKNYTPSFAQTQADPPNRCPWDVHHLPFTKVHCIQLLASSSPASSRGRQAAGSTELDHFAP